MFSHQKRLASALLLTILALSLLLSGCAGNKTIMDDAGKLPVTVSIVPQAYFVERIGGDHVSVSVMVEPGASPATYEPKPEQLVALSKSAAYFSIGVPFETIWLDKIASANPEMLLVDTIAEIERIPLDAHHHGEDEDEEEHEEEAGAPDPHVWLSPGLVSLQAQAMAEALIQLDPDHQSDYETNLDGFLADIDQLDGDIRETLAGVQGIQFMVFHPSWGYFADSYGLEQIAVEVGGQEPSAQELAHLIEEAHHEGIRVVFAQPEFSTSDAETIAKEIGGEVLLVSPLAKNWLENMRTVAQTFAEVLGQ